CSTASLLNFSSLRSLQLASGCLCTTQRSVVPSVPLDSPQRALVTQEFRWGNASRLRTCLRVSWPHSPPSSTSPASDRQRRMPARVTNCSQLLPWCWAALQFLEALAQYRGPCWACWCYRF